MQIQIVSNIAEASGVLTNALQNALTQDSRVLWFVSGGSAIEVEVAVLNSIQNTDNLSVLLIDERYGSIGHDNSNWQQLEQTGFDWSRVKSTPVLNGLDIETTANKYEQVVQMTLAASPTIIGLFGMGADGHTAGILPNSPATDMRDDLVVSYSGPDHQRITITPQVMPYISQAYVYAMGESKRVQLEKFVHQDIIGATQPVQYLKNTSNLTILTDQEGL
jgi:6-phosphogluconolactonase/glucosamine-6-phosphate isomerase/deaminase